MRRARLTISEREEIRNLHVSGYSISNLAKLYGVSFNTIKRIVDPEAYAKHLQSASQYNSENEKRIREQRSKSLRRFGFSLHKVKDREIIDALNGQENITQYIRDLIADDIEKEKRSAAPHQSKSNQERDQRV